MKEKYGSDGEDIDDDEDSEDDETEDEDGEELTPAVDAAILRTLARIKRKDPSIYDLEKDVFEGVSYRTLLSSDMDSLRGRRGESENWRRENHKAFKTRQRKFIFNITVPMLTR